MGEWTSHHVYFGPVGHDWARGFKFPEFPDFPEWPQPTGGLGWVCPKCHSTMAPHQDYCVFCAPKAKTTTTFTTNGEG